MSNNPHIYCSPSLRCRPIWNVLRPMFESTDANVTLSEPPDDTCDIAFHFPCPPSTPSFDLRALIITPDGIEDTNRQATLVRADNFATVQRRDTVIRHQAIFFLYSDSACHAANGQCAIDQFVSLQVLLFESPSIVNLPIIMVGEPAEILASLKEHCYALHCNINLPTLSQLPSPLGLLDRIVDYVSDPLDYQQNLNILSDLFSSIQALSAAVRTTEGRYLVADYLGTRVAEKLISFWNEEAIYG